jgi:hypothetical protein
MLLSPKSIIQNRDGNIKRYRVWKAEGSDAVVSSITINGEPVSWRRAGERVAFDLSLPGGAWAEVEIAYGGNTTARPVELHEGGSYMVYVWRSVAEFRDRILSRFWVTRRIRDFAYESGLAIWIPAAFPYVMLATVCGVVFVWVRKTTKGRESES